MNIHSKTCLVTGAARRVGRVIARHFAEKGARVVVHYRSSEAEARKTVDACRRTSGQEALCLQADLANPEDIQRMVEEANRQTGGVDILVNCASIFFETPFLEMEPETWDRFFAVNLRGPALLAQAVAPHMMEKGGVIINIADVCNETPWKGFLPYSLTKAGLVTLTTGLAKELAPQVRVNAIGPGTVLLDSSQEAQGRREKEIKRTLLKRLGTPEDIAGACLYLVQGSDFITGAFLPVDGGKHIPQG